MIRSKLSLHRARARAASGHERKGGISGSSGERIIIVPISDTVRCYPRYDDATNATVIQTSELSATFKGLKPSTDYAIQVRAKTTRGWGEYTPVVFKKTPHAMGLGKRERHSDTFRDPPSRIFNVSIYADYVGENDNMQVRIIAGAIVAVVVLLVIIIIMTVLILRR